MTKELFNKKIEIFQQDYNQIDNIMQTQRVDQQNLNTQRVGSNEFHQYPYRWAIVGLVGLMFIINGMTNNTVIPIAAKLSSVYETSDALTNAPVTISFLVYSLMNFPANHIIDTKGLRFSFLVGSGLYMAGAGLYTMVNKGYFFMVIGAVLVAIGQPFIINCPAKVATYWFFDKNRPFATAIMTGLLLIGTGFGFVLPTLVVSQSATISQSKNQIFYLYSAQFLASAVAFILVYMFMRKQPPTPPSLGAQQKKTDLKQSFQIFKHNKNLWVFFSGYVILYGTLLSFSSTVNSQLKPYGFSDFSIALFALILILMGVIGSIVWSMYLKKTTNYKFTIRALPLLSVTVMSLICIALNTYASIVIIFLLGGLIGFSVTPIIPISYDLGCQLSFPIGQAQVIGLLNGGAMILAFILNLIITSAVKFKTPSQSMIVMIIYIVLVGFGSIFYFFTKIDLRRRKAEQQGHTVDLEKAVHEGQSNSNKTTTDQNDQSQKDDRIIEMAESKYSKFNQEQEVYI